MLLNNAATSFTRLPFLPGLPVTGRPGYTRMQTTGHSITISPQGKALCLLKTQFAKKPKNPV
jgi:hypothetical protein